MCLTGPSPRSHPRATAKGALSCLYLGFAMYRINIKIAVEAKRACLSPLCATVVRISARRPDRSPEPSLRESHLSPHVSQSDVTSHSPRQDALPQARKPRRQAIPSLLPCDCRLRRSTGGLRRRFARHLRLQTRPLQGERTGGAASKASAASGGQSREESFAGRRARRRVGSPRRFRAEAKTRARFTSGMACRRAPAKDLGADCCP